MDQRDLASFHCLLLLTSVSITSALRCIDNGFFRPNSTFDRNRALILSSLSSNVTAQGGFFNTSIGQGPDRVYALAQCRQRYETQVCARCIDTLSQRIMEQCRNQTEAFSWDGDGYDSCMVRYSNRYIFGSLQLQPEELYFNTGAIPKGLTNFYQIWEDLMLRTLTTASAGTSSSRLKYYAASKEELTYFQTIYVLMQCTPDLAPSDCKSCLRDCVRGYELCCSGKQGGGSIKPSRWDLYPFYGAFENIVSPPQPSPSPMTNQTTGRGKGFTHIILP